MKDCCQLKGVAAKLTLGLEATGVSGNGDQTVVCGASLGLVLGGRRLTSRELRIWQ